MTIIHKGILYMSGDRIDCSINGRRIENATIHIESIGPYKSIRCFICHNNKAYEGSTSPNKHGYQYSWSFRINPNGETNTEVVLRGNLTKEVKIELRKSISVKLMTFIQTQSIEFLYNLFALKLYLPEYLDIDISENKGMILLKKDNRTIEIKIGRFITQNLIIFNKLSNRNITFSQELIEKISNNYVAYQSNNLIQFEYYSGDRILSGYNTSKYADGYNSSTIFKSCMNNKFNFIDLYVKNPTSVKLLVAKMDDKIIGRSLIWSLYHGGIGMDRVYYIGDWVKPLFDEYAKSNGIIRKEDMSVVEMVKLENIDLKYYPYMDTFYYLTKDGLLCRQRQDTMYQKKITRTDGSFYDVN